MQYSKLMITAKIRVKFYFFKDCVLINDISVSVLGVRKYAGILMLYTCTLFPFQATFLFTSKGLKAISKGPYALTVIMWHY